MSAEGVLLGVPPGTSQETVAAAAEIVRGRLGRMAVPDATVTAEVDGVRVEGSADGYQLWAAAQQKATSIAAVNSVALGSCNGTGSASIGSAVRCFELGSDLTGVGAIASAEAQSVPGTGWKVSLAIDSTQYQDLRTALAATPGQLALVADDAVVLTFGNGVPALRSAIGPPLSEDQARLAAAAMMVDSDLPVRLEAPDLPAPSGARVDVDFWTAALGANICGSWLENAPAFGLDTGVHSHGDGLVYVHPMSPDEAGDHATLGLFLERGGWQANTETLQLWDGVEHSAGERCPNGETAQIRWWVDGGEQHGDPNEFTPRNGQVIVFTYGAESTPPDPPPQMSSLYLPALGPEI